MVQVGDATFLRAGSDTLTNTGYLNFVGSAAHGAIVMINQGTITNSGSSDLPLYQVLNDTTGVIWISRPTPALTECRGTAG